MCALLLMTWKFSYREECNEVYLVGIFLPNSQESVPATVDSTH